MIHFGLMLGLPRNLAAMSFASILLVCEAASAEPAAPTEMRAESLFRSGQKKFDEGQYAEACADLAESLRLGPKLGTLLNLALCHEAVGKPATAWSEYHHAAAWAAQNGQKERHEFAMQRVATLETKLPRVLLQLPTDAAIASVDLDGEPIPDSRWYLPVYLDPGEHSVTVGAPGKQRATVRFRVSSFSLEDVVTVPPLADERPPSPPPAPRKVGVADPHRTRRIVGFAAIGAGGLGVAAGLTFGYFAIDRREEIGTRCTGRYCTSGGAYLYKDAQADATVATVSTLVGLAAGAVGAWLLLTSRSAPAPRVQIGAAPGAGGMELGIGGAF